jgi:hypothetical protein
MDEQIRPIGTVDQPFYHPDQVKRVQDFTDLMGRSPIDLVPVVAKQTTIETDLDRNNQAYWLRSQPATD